MSCFRGRKRWLFRKKRGVETREGAAMRHSRFFHGLIGSALALAVVLTGLLETEQTAGAANFTPSTPKPIGIVSVHVPAVLATRVNGRHASSTQTPYLFPALGSCGHFGFCWAPG